MSAIGGATDIKQIANILMNSNDQIHLAFYGDDFTGSTDALEFICRAGARAVLFMESPGSQQLEKFEGINVFGVAGKTRSLPASEMEVVLKDAFIKLRNTGARHIHYKVCSTFDSSPHTGSIGRVLDTGAKLFHTRPIPILGGTPYLGRYCVFGNLFARMGIGSNGSIYRLDRHPSMSKHPVTPSDESDLRMHLQRQTEKKLALIDVVDLQQPMHEWNNRLTNEDAVLIDTLYTEQLREIGAWLDQQQSEQQGSYFSLGSSAVETALGDFWNQTGKWNRRTSWPRPGEVNPLLVVSGSCSPVTAQQRDWAKNNGFAEVVLDAATVCENGLPSGMTEIVCDLLWQQKSVIVHTGSKTGAHLSSQKLGTALGTIARETAIQKLVTRVVVAGGDTSSYAARAMDIEAVEMIAPLVPGAPLCIAHSGNEAINGLEVNFKGGQVGAADYFGVLKNGRVAD